MARVRTQELNGVKNNIDYVNVSAGAADAGKFGILDTNGQWDSTMIPAASVASATAGVAIASGVPISIIDSGGTASMVLADATDDTRPCFGISSSSGAIGETVSYIPLGHQASAAGAPANVANGRFYLGKTPGTYVASTAGFTTGNVIQFLGKTSGGGILHTVSEDIELIA
jgi:hypothetical protein